ncbi:hypothetical protein LPB140_08770 [Sphingorhabdus lutea]|uniref:Zinc ribbon domain-containing protein n=1 Tax=Sphingorhabdus lutea TaxID=1913578 RepID=A0A1L3JCI9_9SPHN|nr:hypothetical protein [Sphingorhabdus lutea]APG62867.1 hypothetical protein LPB140_08770 [Sphingorhabdus lutea]
MTQITCNNCDFQITEGTRFCPQCGEKTNEQLSAESYAAQAKHYVGEAADELYGAAKEAFNGGKKLADADSAKKVAGGAAIGALAGVIAPVGIAAGAAIGAGIVAYRHLNKKNKPDN